MSRSKTGSTTRRSVLLGLSASAGLGGGLAFSRPSRPAQAMDPAKKTFVLVHGAWHGGWCYSRVDPILTAQGHRVFRPTLTGLGDRSHLLGREVSLATHIADIVNLIRWEDLSGVVLCGHSYGGWVIGGAAERVLPRISSIVFLDAFIPENQQVFLDSLPGRTRKAVRLLSRQGALSIPPPPASAFRLKEENLRWVESKLTAQPIRTWLQSIRLTDALHRVPKKTYIRASGYDSRTFRTLHARLSSDLSWRTYEMPSGHDAMIDMPERLAEILVEVA